MAYIGKTPSTKFSAAAKQDSFTGDGSTTTFDVANIIPAGGENSLQVFVDNVRQKPGSSNAYTIGNDGSGDLKRITFTAAPDASAEIYVITPFEATNIKNIGDGTVTTAKLEADAITGAKIADDAVNSEHLTDGSVDNVHLAGSIADSKLSTITTASKVNVSSLSAPGSASVFLTGARTYVAVDTSQQDTNAFNISLLGFKIAVNEGLTVFNLVDGIVDEFHDESGTDEGEGSNDLYCGTSDYYINSTSASGSPISNSAGFSLTAITEPDTSTVGTNPASGAGTFAQFTATGTSVNAFVWGAAGAGGGHSNTRPVSGGGGGFVEGTIATTPGQTLYISAGEGGQMTCTSERVGGFFGGGNSGVDSAPNPKGPTSSDSSCSSGGGVAGVFKVDYPGIGPAIGDSSGPGPVVGNIFLVAGAGGGGGGHDSETSNPPHAGPAYVGGAGGGLTGNAGGTQTEQTNAVSGQGGGGGGDQEQGGQGSPSPQGGNTDGKFLEGADANGPDVNTAAGGAGFFGGGNGNYVPGGVDDRSGGGGSSYFGHPQVTSGATEDGTLLDSGGSTDPYYPSIPYAAGEGTGPGENGESSPAGTGKDGYVLLTATTSATATSTVITSNAFAAGSVPTTSRIVVFEENVATPTLNTDIIASISRDGGSNFTTATLSDSGYVTGSSGQRILTGQATISGQPSGQSMRWKLALANNSVKIHGVSLQWA